MRATYLSPFMFRHTPCDGRHGLDRSRGGLLADPAKVDGWEED